MATPIARVYLGDPSPSTLLASTYDGSGDSTDMDVELFTGQVLTVTFEGGNPGDTAHVSLFGDEIAGMA